MSEPITVPLLDLKAQFAPMRAEILAAMAKVADDQWFIMGPEVKGLEEEIATYCRAKRAIGCASGTDALLLALMAIGVRPGDEIICPSYTFFATGGSISRLGCRPVFVDIDPVTYNMDPAAVREAAKRCTRLRAIMPVHLFGQSVDMKAYDALGKALGVPIIEDAAQAIGAEDPNGIRAGSLGLVGCFSFFPSKNLGGFGDGGICTTSDDRVADYLDIARVHGGKPKYYHRFVGVNSRLDALQAAVIRIKLRSLDGWTAGRQRNASFYSDAFRRAGALPTGTPWSEGELPLRFPAPAAPGARHVWNQYCIRVPAEIRDALRQELTDRKIGTEIYYPVPLHLQECFADLGYRPGSLPETEAAAHESLALPIFTELTDAQKTHVAHTVIEFCRRHAGTLAAAR